MKNYILFCFLVLFNLLPNLIFSQDKYEYWSEGIKCLQIQDYNCASLNFALQMKQTPDYIANYLNLATVYAKIGKYEEALAIYQQGFEKAQAGLLKLKNDLDEAKKNKEEDKLKGLIYTIEEAQIVLAEMYYNRADLHLKLTKPQEAMKDYNMAIQTYAKRAEFFYNRGLLKRKSQDLNGAIQDYTQAIALDSKYEIAYKNRGLALYLSREYAKAVKDYDMTLSLSPQDAETYYNRGLAKMGLLDRLGACADWKKAQQLGSSRATEIAAKYCK
jgi:tetratricopeptide (TPR) repeat protein